MPYLRWRRRKTGDDPQPTYTGGVGHEASEELRVEARGGACQPPRATRRRSLVVRQLHVLASDLLGEALHVVHGRLAAGANWWPVTGQVGTTGHVPQVVDQVAPVPVVTAGGIADGRGLAAALAVGAQGVNVGTRFIASEEAELPEEYKACVLAARSDQTVRAPFVNDLVPSASEGAYSTAPRVVRNTFIEKWQGRDE
ncbi:MAG: nitronate monooxygenase, partial [Actinobacteria bacterium]|nr:nitronate monooxygenase [Actinomycetota bacterium]